VTGNAGVQLDVQRRVKRQVKLQESGMIHITVIVVIEAFTRQTANETNEIFRGDNIFDLVGTHAGSIASADDAAHRSAYDVVDGNVVLFKSLDDANMSETFSSTSTEDQRYLLRVERK